MKNKDLIRQQIAALTGDFFQALQSNDAEAAAKAMQDMQDKLCGAIENEFEQYKDTSDINVLQSRGLRVLTSEENSWYQKFIGAVKTGAKQDITNLTTAIPVTIIDRVVDDLKASHPLLSAISIQDAAGATKLVMNAIQMASKLGSWGMVGSAISEELKGEIKVVDVTSAKYTAYFLIPKDFVKFNFGFAPMWVDSYIRSVLSASVAYGLEKTIIAGDGKNQFIGMTMDISTNASGKYSPKTPVKLADWEDSYSSVIGDLAVDDYGNYRDIPEVLLVVNPKDYIKKIRRVQNAITHAGVIDLLNNTYPTKVVASATMPEGQAVVGIAANYFAAINGGQSGIVEFSDENQFLEDNRVYTTRLYGFGTPVDNKSFTLLDISATEAPALPVKVKGTVTTKASA